MARAPFLGARGWELLSYKIRRTLKEWNDVGFVFFGGRGGGGRETNRLDDDGLVEGVLRGAFWAIGGVYGVWRFCLVGLRV